MGQPKPVGRPERPDADADVDADVDADAEVDVERAARLVDAARCVLLDLDGPVTRLFPGDSWLELSRQVRDAAVDAAVAAGPGPLTGTLARALADQTDHVQCLRIVAHHAPHLLPLVADLVTRAELEVARTATAYPAAVRLIERTVDRGAQVAVVTNNDPRVVAVVLERARPGLTALLAGVHGRSVGTVDDLKPRPDLLLRGLVDAGCAPGDAVFLGDSVTDVQAGEAAGVVVVGVSEDAARRDELRAAGAVAVLPDLTALAPTTGDGPG
ncbi:MULTISPECIES: HAD family hydrolase [unclassified Ornithinimicrobium]|uniref:HAD family hydrolase n=1 Tax=unclassified Ornithinimicrobium TaxID=2615080 RepID=UPI003854E67D